MSHVDEFETAIDSPSVQLKDDTGVFSGVVFYVDPLVNNVDSMIEEIRENGGKVLNEVPDKNSQEWKNTYFVSKRYDEGYRLYVHPSYIVDCVDAGTLLNVRGYLGKLDSSGFIRFDSNSISEDYSLTNQMSDIHASDVTRAAVKVASNHDNAMKPHEQGQELQHMGVHGSADDDAKISLDTQQQLTHVEDSEELVLHENPASGHNKSSFTREEDEFILDVVRKNPTRRTTHTLFDEISHYVPNHTGNSIRHRFRVYLAKRLEFVYQVNDEGKLIRDQNGDLIKTDILPTGLKKKFSAEEDYNLALAVKRQFYRDLFQLDPLTGETLIREDDDASVIAKRKLVMSSEFSPSQIPSFDDYAVEERKGPLSREFFKTFAIEYPTHSENAWRDRYRKFVLPYGVDAYLQYFEKCKAEGVPAEAIKNMTNRMKRSGSSPGNYNSLSKKAKKSMEVSVNTQAPEPNLNDFFLESDAFDLIDGIRRDLHAAEAQQEEQARLQYAEDVAERLRHQVALEHEEYDKYDVDSIAFPPKLAENEEFFDHSFFNFTSTKQFIQKLEEIVTREYDESQADVLVHDLAVECGIRKKYATSVLTALTGDISLLPRYFLTSFKFGVHPPRNVPGIWTKEDDEILRSRNSEGMKILEKKHGLARMQMRLRFQEQSLV